MSWLGTGHRSIKRDRRLGRRTTLKHWFFVFFDGDERLPCYVKPFLTEGFKHVLAFSQAFDDVIVVDPTYRRTEVMIYKNPVNYTGLIGPRWICPAEFIAVDFYRRGGRVVQIAWPSDSRMTSHHLSQYFPGCVTIMKTLLGVSIWCWTPLQFYRWLIENGGTEYTEDMIESIEIRMQEDRANGRW